MFPEGIFSDAYFVRMEMEQSPRRRSGKSVFTYPFILNKQQAKVLSRTFVCFYFRK